jgi:hypothetical protein
MKGENILDLFIIYSLIVLPVLIVLNVLVVFPVLVVLVHLLFSSWCSNVETENVNVFPLVFVFLDVNPGLFVTVSGRS